MVSNKKVPDHRAPKKLNGGKSPALAAAEVQLRELIKARQHQTLTILLTPELAQLLLERRGIQRPVQSHHVDFIKREIKEDKWQHNGATIKISKAGHLIDGQHRCLAVVEAGIAVKTDATIGMDEETFYTIDRGCRIRTATDVLSIARGDIGCEAKTAVAAIRWIVAFERAADQREPVRPKSHDLDDQVIVHSWDQHSEALRPAVQWATRCKGLFRPPGLFAALYYVIHRARKRGATSFFAQLESGEDLHRGDPVLTLRRKLHEIYTSESSKPDPITVAGLVILAWNACVQERTLEKFGGFKRHADGSRKFPGIRTTKFGYVRGGDEDEQAAE